MAQWHTKVELPGIPKEAAWTKLVRKWLQLITEDDFSYLSEEQVIPSFLHLVELTGQTVCLPDTKVRSEPSGLHWESMWSKKWTK